LAGGGRKIALLILVALVAVLLLFLADRNLFDLAVVMLRVDLLAFGGGFGSLPIMSAYYLNERSGMFEASLLFP
jgi:chromate transporter